MNARPNEKKPSEGSSTKVAAGVLLASGSCRRECYRMDHCTAIAETGLRNPSGLVNI